MGKKKEKDVLYDSFTIDDVFDKIKKRKKKKDAKKEASKTKMSIM